MNRRRINYSLTTIATALQILTWACAASSSTIDFTHHHQGQALQSPQFPSLSRQLKELEKMNQRSRDEEEYYRELSKIGSRPPNCRHKCGDCTPCIAIQVPKTTNHLRVQYTNYEPEGWKCKCGSAHFSP